MLDIIRKTSNMPFITSNAGSKPVQIYYEDLGQGTPIVLIHGWPLSSSMWEYQVPGLLKQGFRCIAYDRRGFGKSDFAGEGHDYDTMAGDLNALLEQLDLQQAVLVGFSMGGGEIAKYFANHSSARVSKVVLVSAVVPYMLQTEDNPNGVPADTFAEMEAGIMQDRPSFFVQFNKDFYGEGFLSNPISDAYLNVAVVKCMEASPLATLGCARAFATTDFRNDMSKITVPTLIIHGSEDKTVPIKATAEEAVKLIPNAKLVVYEGEPHGIWFTQKKRLTDDIAAFAS